jgi:hypothetical protein
MAASFFGSSAILDISQFNEVDWDNVYRTLRKEVPRMFQIWASKQVMDTAATYLNLTRRKQRTDPKCPSCGVYDETCAHVLSCPDAGRVEALHMTVDLLRDWMKWRPTDPDLASALLQYAHGRGHLTMTEICSHMQVQYRIMAHSQDRIGWRRFMEGMVSREIRGIQRRYLIFVGSSFTIDRWMSGLIVKLLEVTHGQWLYRNVQVHDDVSGANATARKEEILREIEEQQDLGDAGLMEEDRYLLEVNLDDLENTSGEKQEYWLLAIRAARMTHMLMGNDSGDTASVATGNHNT